MIISKLKHNKIKGIAALLACACLLTGGMYYSPIVQQDSQDSDIIVEIDQDIPVTTTMQVSSLKISSDDGVLSCLENAGDLIQIKVIKDANGEMTFEMNGDKLKLTSIDEAGQILNQLYEKQNHSLQFLDSRNQILRTVPRVKIGVMMEPVQGALASQLCIPDDNAILLNDVIPGSAAQKAGLLRYDVIKQCNGINPLNKDDFINILAGSEPGEHLNCLVIRGGREIELEVELEPYVPEQQFLNEMLPDLENLLTLQASSPDQINQGSNVKNMNNISTYNPLLFRTQGTNDIKELITLAGTDDSRLMYNNKLVDLSKDIKSIKQQMNDIEDLLFLLLKQQYPEDLRNQITDE